MAGGPGRLFTLWLLPRALEAFNSEREKGSVLAAWVSPSIIPLSPAAPRIYSKFICSVPIGPGEPSGRELEEHHSSILSRLSTMMPWLAPSSVTGLPASTGCPPQGGREEGTQPARESRVEGDTGGTWHGGKLRGWVEVPELTFSAPLAMTRNKPSERRAQKVSSLAPNPKETLPREHAR